jgi:allophanate hydrolase
MSTLPDASPENLSIAHLLHGYRSRRFTVSQVIESVFARAAAFPDPAVWITRLGHDEVFRHVTALAGRDPESLPLYGIPFVIKDNIDLAGVATTAACPEFAYTPTQSATVVEKLIAAGAIPIAKTNLDQFATGLVGVRSPYGACRNSIDPRFIAGGSSSGSAVAVAAGLASFSLGTDTAGSGRVPAGFNNLIGLKPSIGRLSTSGVVPACRSLDCVSIFALTAEDAAQVLDVAEGYDAAEVYSRRLGNAPVGKHALGSGNSAALRFGVPGPTQLEFFGDSDYSELFAAAVQRLESLGATRVEIDFAPFLDAARLLYEGPWVAERYAAVGAFLERHPAALYPATRQIIAGGRTPPAYEAFQAQYRLLALKRASETAWSQVDLILTPTAGTIYTIDAVLAEPLRLNATLGRYTNFMNLFDLAGVAVPGGFRRDGLPFGISLIGPLASERALLRIASPLHRAAVKTLGALQTPLPAAVAASSPTLAPNHSPIAVCGAHMEGLPLNPQLRERGAYLLQRTQSAAAYRLYALAGGPPFRPGMIRVTSGGAAIEVEVWAIPTEHLGSFVAGIPAPLGIGKLELADGTRVPGFICEGLGVEGATDITDYGGWRAYLQRDSERAPNTNRAPDAP